MNFKRKLVGLIVAVMAVLVTGAALAQVSTNFDLRWWTHDSGGGQRQSTNFLIRDSMGQVGSQANSANFQVQSGFAAGVQSGAPAPTATPTFTPDPSDTPGSSTPEPFADAYEDDDGCAGATTINTNGGSQNHTFHDEGDNDWLRFTAVANQTYIIEVENVGEDSDAMIFLSDACGEAPNQSGNNAFGTTVSLEWDSIKNGDYFVQIQQYDASYFGENTEYRVSVRRDNMPPSAPTNARCVAIDSSTIGVQWKRSLERDVRQYRVNYANTNGTGAGSDDVFGGDTTYYELGGLTPGQTYSMRVQALDYSANESPLSGVVECTAQQPADSTIPAAVLQQPSASSAYTTTAGKLTFTGSATDNGNNLSRVHVQNNTAGADGWDYALEGGNDTFRVQDIPLSKGDNTVRVRVYDTDGNMEEQSLTITRLGDSPGAVIIIAGHNETFGLQTNIYNSTNRAYRIFQTAGFSPEDIYYIAPVDQDANDDGSPDTDTLSSPAALQEAITVWAAGKVDADKPLFIYMMDHGFEDKFCVSGCDAANSISPDDLDGWLRALEDDTGVDEVTVVIEACVSGSFVNRKNVTDSISKEGRVIITSTGYNNNAYASAQGAYFSDSFFSCIADSNHLKACFDEARQSVLNTGVNQTPFLDDNGDGVYDSGDGTVAAQRYVTRFFSSVRPSIESIDLQQDGTDGTLTATVDAGAESVELVWAAVYPPDFQEPTGVTLNLDVPVVRLDAVDGQENQFSVNYPNGFTQEGDYRLVYYAQDRLGLNAPSKTLGELPAGFELYMPSVHR